MAKLCECGCGNSVCEGSRFLPGHNSKVMHPMKGKRHSGKSRQKQSRTIRAGGRKPQLCTCGCGGLTKPSNRYIHGHNTRGKPRPPEVRRKISEAQKGHWNLTPEQAEKMRQGVIAAWQNPNSGYHKPGYREKLAKANREREHYWGDKISKALKGTTKSKESRRKMSLLKGGTGEPKPSRARGSGWTPALRDEIRERDANTCQECGVVGESHDVHHINYVRKDHRPENLITLCHGCHSKTNKRRKKREYYQHRYTAIMRVHGLLNTQ